MNYISVSFLREEKHIKAHHNPITGKQWQRENFKAAGGGEKNIK